MRLPARSTGGGRRIDVRSLRRRPILAVLLALGVLELLRLIFAPNPLDVVILVLVTVLGVVAIREQADPSGLDGSRRGEAESFSRILRALARSVSPDAIVDAIVEELGAATRADHVAVVRRRPETRNLEAIVSPTRAGAPAARTTLPLRELEDPAVDQALADLAVAASRGRRLTAVPIEPDPAGDPHLDPLGLRLSGDPAHWAPVDRLSIDAQAVASGRRRSSHASPTREGADQRIADRIAARLRDAYGLHNVMAAPLRVNGRVEGAIVLSRRGSSRWPASAGRLLEAAAVETSAALARVYSLREAEARATTDALTGLPNRRYFDEYLVLLSKRRRAEDRVGVLMIDIDRFKTLNDTFGHAVGDHVLREVAQAIAGAVREDDVPARFGGEEFAVLLKNPSPAVAIEVGERVRRSVGALDLRKMGVQGVSVSVGVAVAEEPDVSLDAVIDEADRALYRAKRGGRDRVVAA